MRQSYQTKHPPRLWREYAHLLTDRQKYILELSETMQLIDIAEQEGVTPGRIWQIRSAAIQKLRREQSRQSAMRYYASLQRNEEDTPESD